MTRRSGRRWPWPPTSASSRRGPSRRRTTDRLGLTIPPDELLNSLTVEPVGAELVLLTLTAPNDAEAVRRLDALTAVYLEFRAEQLALQSKVVVDGLQRAHRRTAGRRGRAGDADGKADRVTHRSERQQAERPDRPAGLHPGPDRFVAAVGRGCHAAQRLRGGVQPGARPPGRRAGAGQPHLRAGAGVRADRRGRPRLRNGAVLRHHLGQAASAIRRRERPRRSGADQRRADHPVTEDVALVAPACTLGTVAGPTSGSGWPTRSRTSCCGRTGGVGSRWQASTTPMRSASPSPRPPAASLTVAARSPSSISPHGAAAFFARSQRPPIRRRADRAAAPGATGARPPSRADLLPVGHWDDGENNALAGAAETSP